MSNIFNKLKPDAQSTEINPNQRKQMLILFGVFTFVLLFLFYIFPYTRDDWAWGSSIGIDRMMDLFRDYNGRYGGNLAEILLTRSPILKAVISALVLSGIVLLMVPKGRNRISLSLLAMCFVMLIPLAVFRQTIAYTAGFSNYVIPTLFMLFFIRYFKDMYEKDKVQDLSFNPYHTVPVALLALISCLFMEHITLYLTALSFIILVYSRIKFKKIFAVQVGFFAGSLLGSVLMFSNGAYWNVLNGSDGYRHIGTTASSVSGSAIGSEQAGTAAETTGNYAEDIVRSIFTENFFFNIILGIAVIVLIKKNHGKLKHKSIMYAGNISGVLLIGLTAINTISLFAENLNIQFNLHFYINIFLICIYILLVIACFVTLILAAFSQDKITGHKLLFIVGSLIVLNIPLILVNPVSPRCFFPAFILMCMFIIECLNRLTLNRRVSYLGAGILIIAFIILFSIYIPIYKGEIDRVNMVKNKVADGQNVISIPNLPNEDFVWIITPESGTKWEYRYKKYYDIPEDIKLVNDTVDYSELYRKYN